MRGQTDGVVVGTLSSATMSRPARPTIGRSRIRTGSIIAAAAMVLTIVGAAKGHAYALMPGATGEFEEEYLQFILDHHYSGLRPTELAAGTDSVGRTESAPYLGNPASYPPTPQKGTDPVVLEIASMSNEAQRREIHTGQGFLQSWYGYTATLDVPPSGQELLTRHSNRYQAA